MTAQTATATDYDTVAYPSYSHSIAHPDVMAVMARLYGLAWADVGACRVLELGCGDGAHIIPIALANPASTFLGVDLSRVAVERGRRHIERLGLDNVRLDVADVTDWRPEPDAFDYVIAHGLYAWIPPEAQAGVLAATGRALRSGGLAMISYNVAPGHNLRLIMRELLQYALRGIDDLAERGRRAHDELRLLLDEVDGSSPIGLALRHEVEHWLKASPAFMLHDILGAYYAPTRLPELVQAAAPHGLSYLGDATAGHIRREAFPNETDARVLADSSGDLVEAEHRHDLRAVRVFRHTLLRKGPPDVPRTLDLAAIEGLHASLSPRLAERETLGEETDGRWTMTFTTSDGHAARIGGPPARRFLEALAKAFPGSVPVADLGLRGAEGLRIVAMLFAGGAIRLRSHPLPIAPRVGERPKVDAYTRLQAAAGQPSVTRLDHEMVKVDAMAARLLTLMDGTRTASELATQLAARAGGDETAIRAAIPENLERLRTMGLVLADEPPPQSG